MSAWNAPIATIDVGMGFDMKGKAGGAIRRPFLHSGWLSVGGPHPPIGWRQWAPPSPTFVGEGLNLAFCLILPLARLRVGG